MEFRFMSESLNVPKGCGSGQEETKKTGSKLAEAGEVEGNDDLLAVGGEDLDLGIVGAMSWASYSSQTSQPVRQLPRPLP